MAKDIIRELREELVLILAGGKASQRNGEPSREVSPKEQAVGMIKNPQTIELLHLSERVRQFMEDYPDTILAGVTSFDQMFSAASNAQEVMKHSLDLSKLIRSLIVQCVMVEFPATAGDDVSVGVRKGWQIVVSRETCGCPACSRKRGIDGLLSMFASAMDGNPSPSPSEAPSQEGRPESKKATSRRKRPVASRR